MQDQAGSRRSPTGKVRARGHTAAPWAPAAHFGTARSDSGRSGAVGGLQPGQPALKPRAGAWSNDKSAAVGGVLARLGGHGVNGPERLGFSATDHQPQRVVRSAGWDRTGMELDGPAGAPKWPRSGGQAVKAARRDHPATISCTSKRRAQHVERWTNRTTIPAGAVGGSTTSIRAPTEKSHLIAFCR